MQLQDCPAQLVAFPKPLCEDIVELCCSTVRNVFYNKIKTSNSDLGDSEFKNKGINASELITEIFMIKLGEQFDFWKMVFM